MTTDPPGPTEAASVVLVVEDEVLVRMLACDILDTGGFRNLEAVDPREALALIIARPDIAVMFTDVDMPGEVNGLGLAHLVSKQAPRIKILVTSGASIPQDGDLPPGARFLQKPYSPSTLLDLVTDMLAADR